MSDNIVQFRPDTAMSEVAKTIERLLSVMRRNGQETMLCEMDGYRISVQPIPALEKQP